MAFKKSSFASTAASNPAAHFKTLTKRFLPDVMPHQKDILEAYASTKFDSQDLAIQLPTGSGKTLAGLLIADWRRIKDGDRAVYLCPTRQLVRQTVLQAQRLYGIDVVDLSGRKAEFLPDDRAAYRTGEKIAISTYSAFFNTNTFFNDSDLIIVDDAHAAENYIAKMWSLQISQSHGLFDAMVELLKGYLTPQETARLTGEWTSEFDLGWVEKLPTPLVNDLEQNISTLIDARLSFDDPELYFPWTLLRSHLVSCHIYLGVGQILIRPLIPPTFSHQPFVHAKQRIFMSATLGEGGDLERLTGRKKIDRLPAPEGFQSAGVGRRFFIFPELSLNKDETSALRTEMQGMAGRSVVLTTSTKSAQTHLALLKSDLSGHHLFDKDDIENDKDPFVSTPNAVAVLANRYDGIDFPGDECRLLCVDGLPKAMNLQEKFLMSKMGAGSLYNDRVQTRVLQAMGRCTRSLQDRSAVVVSGTELVDFLSDNRKWKYLQPELQAELAFGVEQSKAVSANDIKENFEMFLENSQDWASADGAIRTAARGYQKEAFPAMNELSTVVKDEINYQEAIWSNDLISAVSAARSLLGKLSHPSLRGYRALWHYLLGAAEQRLASESNDSHVRAAIEQYNLAKKAAPSVSWLSSLSRVVDNLDVEAEGAESLELKSQVENIERNFISMGSATNHRFEKLAARIEDGLRDFAFFEQAQVELGTMLGFKAGNNEDDAAPDPWWLGHSIGVVFEDHQNGDESTIFGATKARQAADHPRWLRMNVPAASSLELTPVLVTPSTQAKDGAAPQLEEVVYWNLRDYIAWTYHAIAVLRDLKSSFPGDEDLFWRTDAAQTLHREGLTLESIASRPRALNQMRVVP